MAGKPVRDVRGGVLTRPPRFDSRPSNRDSFDSDNVPPPPNSLFLHPVLLFFLAIILLTTCSTLSQQMFVCVHALISTAHRQTRTDDVTLHMHVPFAPLHQDVDDSAESPSPQNEFFNTYTCVWIHF